MSTLDQYERPIGFSFSDPGGVQRWANGSEAKPGDQNYAYQYDGAGNITSIGTWNEATGQAGPSDAFTYDLLSRLTSATINRAGYAHGYSYAYDAFGNLLGRTEALQNGAVNLKASIMNTAGYRVPSQAPDETTATNYIKEVAFTAQLAAGANGVTNNRLSSITRGGTVMGVDTGLSQEQASMVYDPNGNLLDDGKFLYGYDALNRQVSVTEKSTGLLLSESSYLASGERVAKISYAGGSVSDYARYVREGSAVVWEKADGTGHEKRYVYAGGRMAYTKEAWVTCTLPKTLSLQTTQLATTSVAADANGTTTTATISLPNLPPEANAVEVRLVKGNSLVASQRMDRPEGGQWCGYEQAVFAGLPEGNDYQAGITLFFREGRAKIMPLKPYLVERMKLGIVKGKLAAWTVKQLKADNESVQEETTTGFSGLAPDGAEDYTAIAGQNGAMQVVAEGRDVSEAQMPQGAGSVSVAGSQGTQVNLAAPSLGTNLTRPGGGIVPQCTRHALNTYYATDHLGTVRFVKTIDETGTEVATTTHAYEPFGVEITPTDSCDNTHRFTGHERDVETGNDYMHARYYGSNLARFMKPDVIPGKPGDPQSWNLYAYVRGNPVNLVDPLGLDWFQVDGKWQWRKDKGSYTYTDGNGKQQTAKGYQYLMVVKLESIDKKGVSHYSVNLYYQNEKKAVASGTAFSGGAPKNGGGQYSSIPDGNYTIKATSDMHHPAPSQQNPQSADNNPMPDYGIQPVPDSSSNGYLHAVWEAYGPMRARLNPMSPGIGDSYYFHGQQPDANHAGSTSGCLSYGTDDTVISAIWNTNSNVPVSIDTPVVMP